MPRALEQTRAYDAIVLTGSVPVLADEFARCLNPGDACWHGREAPAMEARLVTCAASGACSEVGLFETCIPALRNAPQPERFVF